MEETKPDLFHPFSEVERHLMEDTHPSAYFLTQPHPLAAVFPFTMIFRLKNVPQSPKHHPEGDVFVHTLMVVDEAAAHRAQAKDPRAFMWAAVLHDIGKAATTRRRQGRLTAYDHDKAGEKLAMTFISTCGQSETFAEQVSALVRYHMHMFFVLNRPELVDKKGLRTRVDLDDLALLSYCDRIGRTGADRAAELNHARRFVEAVRRGAQSE